MSLQSQRQRLFQLLLDKMERQERMPSMVPGLLIHVVWSMRILVLLMGAKRRELD